MWLSGWLATISLRMLRTSLSSSGSVVTVDGLQFGPGWSVRWEQSTDRGQGTRCERPDRALCTAEDLGRLLNRQIVVEAQHQHRSLPHWQVREQPLKVGASLVIDTGHVAHFGSGWFGGQQADALFTAPGASALVQPHVHDDPANIGIDM